MRPEPAIREDGRCALDSCRKAIKPPKRRRDVPARLYEDPFCSTDCCKAFHGVATPQRDATKQGRPRVYAAA